MANNIFKELEKNNMQGVRRSVAVFPSSVHARTPQERTPLHVAAMMGEGGVPFLVELLTHGAVYDSVDRDGNTPLHLASTQGWVEAVGELLTGPGRKLVLKVKNKDGQTPLHLAARAGHADAVQRLLDAGARADSKDKAGCTPLDLAPPAELSLTQLLQNAPNPASTQHQSPSPAHSTPPRHSSSSVPAAASLSALLSPTVVLAGASAVGASRLGISASSGGAVRSSLSARKPGGGPTEHSSSSGGTAHREPPPPPLERERASHNLSGPVSHVAAATNSKAAQQNDVQLLNLQVEVAVLSERLDRYDASAAAQVEMGSQLAEALAIVNQQSRQMADMEQAMFEQAFQMQAIMSSMQEMQESAMLKEATHAALQSSVESMTMDNLSVQTHVGELSKQLSLSLQHTSAPAAQEEGGKQQQMWGDVQAVAADVLNLKQQLELLEAASVTAKLAELATQVQQLSARAALQPAVESLERKVGELREAGLPDKMELLQLKLAQITAPVAALVKQHEDMSAQVASLQLQLLTQTEAGTSDSADPTQANESTLANVWAQINATDARLESMQAAFTLHQLTPTAAAAGSPTASTPFTETTSAEQPAPLSVVIELQEQLLTLRGIVSGLTAKEETTGGGSNSSSPGLSGKGETEDGTPAFKTQLSELKATLHELKRSTAAEIESVRRTNKEASSSNSGRYTEQNVELSQREANLRSLRDDLLTTENKRQERVQLDSKVAAQLKQLELDVALLTHQVEVLDDQMECQIQAQQNLRSSSCGYGELLSPRLHSQTGPTGLPLLMPTPSNTPLQPTHTLQPHTSQPPPQQQQPQQQQQTPTNQKQQQQQQEEEEEFADWHHLQPAPHQAQHVSPFPSSPPSHLHDSDSSATPTRPKLHQDNTSTSPPGPVAENVMHTPSTLLTPSSQFISPSSAFPSPAPHHQKTDTEAGDVTSCRSQKGASKPSPLAAAGSDAAGAVSEKGAGSGAGATAMRLLFGRAAAPKHAKGQKATSGRLAQNAGASASS